MAWPDLEVTPDLPITAKPRDNTIRSESEAGYVPARPRFTRKTYEFGPHKYSVLTRAELDLLLAHYDEVGCDVIFPWTWPVIGTVHNVRFKEPPTVEQISPNCWSFSYALEEV